MPAAKFNPYHDELGRFTTADGAGGGDGAQPAAFKPRGGGGKPPAPPPQPPPPAKPAAKPDEPGSAPPPAKPAKPSEQRLEDILKPGGKELGERRGGAGGNVRTIDSIEFDGLRAQLLDGSTEVPAQKDYFGKWFQRPDG
ncbi:MAG: hypothetical protein CTY20_08345, partial [Hyphomicrobium sp.]